MTVQARAYKVPEFPPLPEDHGRTIITYKIDYECARDQIDLSPSKASLLPRGSHIPRPKKLARINIADSMDPEDRAHDGVWIFKLNLGGVGR